jgi:hypothetical protein
MCSAIHLNYHNHSAGNNIYYLLRYGNHNHHNSGTVSAQTAPWATRSTRPAAGLPSSAWHAARKYG